MKKLNRLKGFLVRWITRKIYYPLLFNFVALFHPIQEDKVIFLELRLPSLSNSFQEIYNELVRNYNLNIHCHFFRISFVTKTEQYKRMRDFVIDAATAKYLIYAEGSDVHGALRKRKGQHILNTWHAAGAFKKFGLSTADKIFGDSYKDAKRFPSHGDYDIVTVSSPEIEWAYAEAMDKKDNPECIKSLGLSRTDVFYRQETIDKAYEHFYKLMPQAKGKKVISYAPTFRGRSAKALTPDMLDVKKFKKELSDEYVLIFKHHPITHNRPVIPMECSDFAADFTEQLTIEELICITDIMIADYSSTIFEYALFEKPMVFFAYDLYNYFDWRGFYYNYDELTPGPVCFTNAEVIDYIKHVDERFNKAEVHDFKEKFMKSCDGHATKRIMDAFFEPSIEKYKREEPLEGTYHTLTSWEESFADKKASFKNHLKVQKVITPIYENAAKTTVSDNSVVFLTDKGVDKSVFASLKATFEAKGGFEIHDKLRFSLEDKTKLKENARILATAKYILAAGDPFVLRMIKIRPETKLIQICPEMVPAGKKADSIKALSVGIDRDEAKAFPLINSYDFLTGMDEALDKRFLSEYFLKETGKILHEGNPSMDVLLNDKFAQEAKDKIAKDYSFAKDKRIISLLISGAKISSETLDMFLKDLHEEFARSCVVLLKDLDGYGPIEYPEYLQGFVFTTDMALIKCIAASDAVISDSDGYSFAPVIAGKAFFRWTNGNVAASLNVPEIDAQFDKITFDSHKELIESLKKDISENGSMKAESSSAKALDKFVKASKCDGKVAERIVDILTKS